MTTNLAVETMVVSPVEMMTLSTRHMDNATVAQHAAVTGADRVADAIQPATDQDDTILSPASAALAGAMLHSDVRMDKVLALRERIANGTYYVSAADLAGKMLEAMLG